MAADTFSRVPTRAVPRAALSEVKAETLAKAETRHSWQEFAMAKKKKLNSKLSAMWDDEERVGVKCR
jgi:hypothetical protein